MNNAPDHSDLIRGRAQAMVRAHEAPDFRTACSMLSKRAAGVRSRRKRNRDRARSMWYNNQEK